VIATWQMSGSSVCKRWRRITSRLVIVVADMARPIRVRRARSSRNFASGLAFKTRFCTWRAAGLSKRLGEQVLFHRAAGPPEGGTKPKRPIRVSVSHSIASLRSLLSGSGVMKKRRNFGLKPPWKSRRMANRLNTQI